MLTSRFRVIALAVLLGLAAVAVAIAQAPARNISGRRHPHLAAAQRMSHNAFEQILQAQQANEWDMQGHAQRAKDLLDQANNELRQAASAANAK
jgi:hypothetical protein